MAGFVGTLIGILIAALLNGLIIWVVGKLRLGLEVDGFLPAFLAAIVIAVLNGIIVWLFGSLSLGASGWLATVVAFLVAAAVLYTAGSWIKGIRVKGFGGALIGALAIAIVGWLVALAFAALAGAAA